jgi:opacity protein-like surface antigen
MMMKKGLVLIAGMLMSGLTMMPAAHAQQPYAGIGIAALDLDTGADRKLTSGIFLRLGDDFSPYLGGELRLGTTDRASNGSRVNWFAGAYAKPKIDISQDVTLYGLLGVTAMRADYTSLTTNLPLSSTKASFSYGLGIEYWAANQLTVNADWMRYASHADVATKNTSFKGLTIDSYSVSAVYHF